MRKEGRKGRVLLNKRGDAKSRKDSVTAIKSIALAMVLRAHKRATDKRATDEQPNRQRANRQADKTG